MPHPDLPRRRVLPLLAALAAAPHATSAAAQELPATARAGGRDLVLNGTGTRRAWGFAVFRAGLYLEARSADAAAILASPGPKLVRLRYLRDIPRDRLVSGWEEGFAEVCRCAMPPAFRARLRDLPEGQEESFLFLPDRAEVAYAGEAPVRVEGGEASRGLLGSFIGPEAQSAGLRRGLLGG